MEMASLARVLLLLLAGEASALRHFASGVTSANAVQHLAVSRAASVQMVDNPWNEPILDESLPDPVFDDDYQYKGYSRFGFVEYAEAINGRAAMMGFTILFIQELLTGKGVLELYGLPYDAGAVISP
mmetsp:Transcript_27542/g.53618  ORF Transcript_27542/g.53618 Transcript_27542/m.53618 type:complete len:127 (+) Transcript_27542:30-410(+)